MGWEHEPETVWRAQELYCVDRLTFEQVAEKVGVAASTLKRWAEKYGWRDKREKVAQAEADIPADKVLARSVMLKALIGSQDPQTAFAVASLENMAMKAEAARAKESPTEARREIRQLEDVADALREAVELKLAWMLADPANVDFAAIKNIWRAGEMIGSMKAKDEGKGIKQPLTPESAERFRREILGIK